MVEQQVEANSAFQWVAGKGSKRDVNAIGNQTLIPFFLYK